MCRQRINPSPSPGTGTRRFRATLLAASLLLALPLQTLPAAATTTPAKPSVAKPVVQKPTVKKPVVKKPAPVTKPRSKVAPPKSSAPVSVAGQVAAVTATGLALGTLAAPALPRDADQGVRNLEQQARQGDVEAQMALAEHFASGTPPADGDMRRALYWYGQAAAKGDADACWTLAELFRGDLGVTPDLQQTASWYTKAAELGHAEAAFDLGLLYMDGEGVEPDPVRAAGWFEQAADAGIARAFFMLGTLYEQGVDGAPDPESAAGWYQRAADGGDVNARVALQRLAAGQPNVALTDGPPPGMLGGPPGGQQRRPATTAPATTSSAAPAAVAGRPVPVDQAGVKEIQTLLIRQGYHKGKPDGLLGKRTSAAIRAYQKAKGLKVDGTASQALLERLRRG